MKRNGHSADARSLRGAINAHSAGGFVGFYAKFFLDGARCSKSSTAPQRRETRWGLIHLCSQCFGLSTGVPEVHNRNLIVKNTIDNPVQMPYHDTAIFHLAFCEQRHSTIILPKPLLTVLQLSSRTFCVCG